MNDAVQGRIQGRPLAGAPRDDTVTAVLGPTNTGKTHYAIERMLGHRTGVIGLPLRLLAREIYDRIVSLRGPSVVALVTGEEKIVPARTQYWVCTAESMPLEQGADFVAIDEIQLCADPERGHVFTDRLLNARGLHETLLLGSDTMRGRIAELIPRARFLRRERFSRLTYSGSKKISRIPPRAAIVGFSADNVYSIAELIRRQKGGAAVVMGALSPRTRNAQVALYQNGDVDHLVATDAIGMGLNLDVRHVAFSGLSKFDGRRFRDLAPNELAQIAGRAGRYQADGTFGVTGEAPPLDPEVVDAIENHRFMPVRKLLYRNSRLEFGTVPALIASLETAPELPGLMRGRDSDDVLALRALAEDHEVAAMARGGPQVRRLWEVCQIPDFRKTAEAEHIRLLNRIYRFLLSDQACIPSDWLEAQIARVDRTEGDIDTLSKRLAFIRTWTYVANRRDWVDDPARWRETAQAVEDRLSDALHERLTQRFVDRRTSVLMRRLKQKESLVADVNDKGEVIVEGHAIGRLDGFRFIPDPAARGDEAKTLRAAGAEALQANFARLADKFYNAPDPEIDATEQGGLMWGDVAVGKLVAGADALSPGVEGFVDEMAGADVKEKVERRLTHWINRKIAALFEPLIAMRDDEAMTGLARGVAYRLVETLGVIPRAEIANDVKSLDQDGRGLLRKHGVRFGQHTVFMPLMLKPAPTRMRLILWSLASGLEEFPEAPPPGLVTIPKVEGAPDGFYSRAGYRLAGARAIRIDMLERLADQIRNENTRGGFEAKADMLSITGCTLEQFADLMQGLGYKAERGERPKAPPEAAKPEPAAETAVEPAETPVASVAEPAPVDEPPVETSDAEAPADAPPVEASVEEAPADAPPVEASVEEAPVTDAPSESAAIVETPAEDPSVEIDAEAPAEETAVEMQVFYTFTWAPKPRGDRAGRDRRPRNADAVPGGKPERVGKPDGRGKPKGPRKGKGAGRGKPDGKDKDRPREFSARPPKQDKPIDPDNPFAALMALKQKR